MTPTPLDTLIRSLLPVDAVPPHLCAHDILDPDYEPDPRHADAVASMRELVARGGAPREVGPRLKSSRDVATYFSAMLGSAQAESIVVVGFNARLHVVFNRVVARGGVASCPARVADLMRPLVLNAAHAMVLVHNHPSGDPSPSQEDISLTRKVVEAASLLDIRLLDHVIVTAREHFSFLDAGLIPNAQ